MRRVSVFHQHKVKTIHFSLQIKSFDVLFGHFLCENNKRLYLKTTADISSRESRVIIITNKSVHQLSFFKKKTSPAHISGSLRLIKRLCCLYDDCLLSTHLSSNEIYVCVYIYKFPIMQVLKLHVSFLLLCFKIQVKIKAFFV